MKIASVLENQKIEKRIAITPETAKKYISLGLEVSLSENYGSHLGIKDEEYKKLGASILKDEKEIISNTDILVVSFTYENCLNFRKSKNRKKNHNYS